MDGKYDRSSGQAGDAVFVLFPKHDRGLNFNRAEDLVRVFVFFLFFSHGIFLALGLTPSLRPHPLS